MVYQIQTQSYKTMSQLFLTNFSIIIIKHVSKINEEDAVFCLGNESIIRSEVFFEHTPLESLTQNQLFYVQVEGGNKDFKVAIQFEKTILLRHKLSNKYLSYSTVIEDEENDSTMKLELSEKECYFKFMPCFQYQTKISNKIKFCEDVFLATELSSAKLGYVSIRPSEHQHREKIILGLNYKEKLMLHCYYEIEEEETGYLFGQAVWLTHVDSETFLTVVKSKGKREIMFEPLNREEEEQSIKGLWLIDSVKTEIGGALHFNEHFYLKSLCTNKYLTLSKDFKVVNGRKVFSTGLQDRPNELSKFVFESLKGQENKIKKKSYLIIKHVKSQTFIGTRKSKQNTEELYFPFMTFDYFQDEDLFKMTEIQSEDEETFRFIFSFKDQQKNISNRLRNPALLSPKRTKEIKGLYENMLQEFIKLSSGESFIEVQEQLGEQLEQFYFQIQNYHQRLSSQRNNQAEIESLIRSLYQIMKMLSQDYRDNQEYLYENINVFIDDILKDFGAEELFIEIFRNNYALLCKLPDPMTKIQNKNLINLIFQRILNVKIAEKNDEYWKKILKIFDFIDTVLYHNEKVIDINQRLISTELFERNVFNLLFFELKAVKQRIKINHPVRKAWCELDQVREPMLLTIVERMFKLFSSVCQDRNFISKIYVHQYINHENEDQDGGVKIIITYLNIPISPHLSNHLYSLITNCYIDSSPRIDRIKPLSIILFNIHRDESEGVAEGDQTHRLQANLLNKESHYVGKSLRLSNVMTSFQIREPSLNEQEMDLYKGELNERISSSNWTSELLKSIKTLVRLQSYSIPELKNIKNMLQQQIMGKSLQNDIIPQAMMILDELNICCEELEIKKVTSFLKYKFSNPKKKNLEIKDVPYFLAYSDKLKAPPKKAVNADSNQIYMVQSQQNGDFREEYNETVLTLKDLYPSKKLKKYLFEMFIDSEKYSFSIISSLFRQIIRYNFPKLTMMKILSKSIVITGEEVKKFQQLFELYKKMSHLNCISEHWLYSKYDEPQEYKHFVGTIFQFTNFLYHDYVLFSQTNKNFRKHFGINVNRQLLLQNLGIHNIVLTFLSENYYLLDQKIKGKLSMKQRHTFEECFQFLLLFCSSCKENMLTIKHNIETIEKLRGSVEVGQTKMLIMLYQTDDNLIKQINQNIVQIAVSKIIKNLKAVPFDDCEYNPEFPQFLLNISMIKEKPLKKNIAFIEKTIDKEANFRAILFLQKMGNQYSLALSLKHFSTAPLRVPFLYHKKVIKLICIMIQNLEYMGTRIRNRLKQYVSQESLFRLLSLPDIYSHQGIIPQLNFLLKKELFTLLNLYLDKNDSLSKLYESKSLQSLLDHFMNIFLGKPMRITIVEEYQDLFVPFLKEYQHEIKYDRENQRDFFTQFVHPLLSRLYNIFEKMSNREKNMNFRKTKLLLEDIRPMQLTQDHLLKNIKYGIDLIDLKWRNFVDADEDNSEEEKYAKKTLLELLKHKQTVKQVDKEREQFYAILEKNDDKFFKVMGSFIKMASEEDVVGMSDDSNEIFYEIIQQLAEYLQWTTTKGKEFKGLKDEVIVQTLIGYVTRQSFDYSNEVSRKTFYEILRIFVILLQNEEEAILQKVFFDYFKTEISSYRFFACLNSALVEVFDRIEGQKMHEQINFALNQLSLCGEEKKLEIDRQALKFIKNLCRYSPFTDFFRDQPFTVSIDFLQRIFNLFYIMIKRNQSENLIITISVVDIIEPIIDCMMWMLNGCNQNNQNYVIDTKFPVILVEMLKKEVIKPPDNRAEVSKRDMLLEEVVNFYDSNGINIKDLLEENIKFLDFNHIYLLNRLKLTMLRLLHQCSLANDRVLSKLKIMISVELLKINLIWTYNDFLDEKLEYSQENILRVKEDWREIVRRDDLAGTFLMIGFYFYIFIEYYKKEEKDSKDDDQTETAEDEQKQKEKVIKKFFSSIAEREKKTEKEKALQKEQQFGKEMAKFYQNYYSAYKFYNSKTLTIEATIFGKLTKIYFPRIPLCDKVTEKVQEKQVKQAERISHEQKIKSLMEFQQQTYTYLNGEEEYFKRLQQKSEIIASAIQLVKDEDDIFLIIWIVSCLITINYLLYDYVSPFHYFNQLIMYFVTPADFLSAFMLILQLINLFFGLVLLFNMCFKKIPFLLELYSVRYEKQESEKEAKQAEKGIQNTYAYYIASNLFVTIAFDIYYTVFCFLTLVHPVFAGFQLIYIISRIAIGQQIILAIKQTAFSLFAATGLLIICNYVYSMLIYIAYTDDIGYGGTCKNLFQCLLMVFDQSLKGDAGFLGNVDQNYTYNVFTVKLLCEIFYILFVKKVIFEIFSGTIIDKFSELRQKGEETEEDEKSNCYICGQERFEIDFQLQGFEEHVKNTHNKFNYVFYLFYLRRKEKREFGIEENHIWQLHEKEINDWIPDGTSLLKEEKETGDEDEEKKNYEQQYEKYFHKKMSEMKKLKQKMEFIGNQLNEGNKWS